jgi:hypothetical protein
MAPTAKPSDPQLQKRDFQLLCGLFESRVMTAAQIAALYFAGKREAAKKRLQKLKAAGLLRERKRRVNQPSVLFLTRKGFSLLSEQNVLAEYPQLSPSAFEKRADVSELTLSHELAIMDVKAAFYTSLRKSDRFRIAEFSTWPLLHQFRAMRPGPYGIEVLVKPDGFVRIHEMETDGGVSEHTFFLEVDRSTETQATLVNRAACYLEYYKSGGFAVANGADRSAFKDYPFRVLIVLKNEERRNNTIERLLQSDPPILTMVYLTTAGELAANATDKIWIRPRDYRDAFPNLASQAPRATMVYRRYNARDSFVEDKIKKITLLE